MLDSISQDNSNAEIEEIKGIEVNVDLCSSDKPLKFSGNEYLDARAEQQEKEIQSLKTKIDELTKRVDLLSRVKKSRSKFDENDFDLSDNEDSVYPNDNLQKTKSGRYSASTEIAYLYSVPLVKAENSKIISLGLPINHNAEIDQIIENLEAKHKMINFRIETATVEALQNLFLKKPKIVLLSCHGDYDKEDKTYYLAFESENIGVMEKLDMNRIKILFETQKHSKSIECMIVSACHSQSIGKLMNESGVPVVIAINAPFKIQDEAARSFGKIFLSSLVQGTSYDEAFSCARRFVAAHRKAANIYSGGCAHPHTEDGPWSKKAKDIGHLKAHELHMPTCKCNLTGNLHYYAGNKLGNFADEFLEKYATWNYYRENKQNPDGTNLGGCSPDMPHDESMKFVMICEEKEYLSKKPFEKLEDGPLNIISSLPTENVPINVGNLAAVGRNVLLHYIVDSLSYSGSTQTRLVHIYGNEGVGKTYVAKHAAKYLFERKNFNHGCLYIEIKNKYAVGENLISLIGTKIGIPSTNKQTLGEYISKLKILIILDKSSKISSLDHNMLNKTLEYFIAESEVPKFIVITDHQNDITIQNKVQFEIQELKPKVAALLLLLCANQYIEQKK